MITISCSKTYEFRAPVDPGAATLSKPANNSQCLEVDKVKFEWNKSDNTDTYTITIIDLISSTTVTQNTSTNTVEITLPKGRPYSWQITSKNESTSKTAKSEVWKFYLSGAADSNHAPFPAEIIAPKNETTVSAGSIELSWKVSDVDVGDTHKFDVKLDKTNATTVISTDQADTKKTVTLTAGVYYWRVVAKDNNGNHSESGVYKFTVQ
ncbi:uncharacterized protein METZ01_LOCUS38945 [marine metagenome]|uniref:Fibronectin type-III domain-containing protein n=1 Tax=marine metagenome TaxID=408172 RepID=A0A381R2X8_9ZZZZ